MGRMSFRKPAGSDQPASFHVDYGPKWSIDTWPKPSEGMDVTDQKIATERLYDPLTRQLVVAPGNVLPEDYERLLDEHTVLYGTPADPPAVVEPDEEPGEAVEAVEPETPAKHTRGRKPAAGE